MERDFLSLNKKQVDLGISNSKQTTLFRKYNDSVKHSKNGKNTYNIVLPEEEFRYGVENRPSTPVKLVIGNCFGLQAQNRQAQIYRIIEAQKGTQKKAYPQKSTKTNMLRYEKVRSKLRFMNGELQHERFKLPRFGRENPKVNSNLINPQLLK